LGWDDLIDSFLVIPAQAGIHIHRMMPPRLRGGDEVVSGVPNHQPAAPEAFRIGSSGSNAPLHHPSAA